MTFQEKALAMSAECTRLTLKTYWLNGSPIQDTQNELRGIIFLRPNSVVVKQRKYSVIRRFDSYFGHLSETAYPRTVLCLGSKTYPCGTYIYLGYELRLVSSKFKLVYKLFSPLLSRGSPTLSMVGTYRFESYR